LQLGCQSFHDLRLLCCASIANDKSASNNNLGEFFFKKLFFPFLFSRMERTRFGCCGLRVEQHADNQKQVARLVACGMFQLQSGCLSFHDLLLLCCASIANDESASNNNLGEFFFKKLFFLFLFSRTERPRFVWWELRVEQHAHQPKQVARLVACGMFQLQPGCQSFHDLRLSRCASIANNESASNNSLGEFFFKKLFFPFLFSRTERTRFGCCGLRVEQHADNQKQVARLVACGMFQLQSG
jgi:hypothetical protein